MFDLILLLKSILFFRKTLVVSVKTPCLKVDNRMAIVCCQDTVLLDLLFGPDKLTKGP